MPKPKVFEKPIGFRDYLPDVVKKLRAIEHRVLGCMESWGYEQIMTPTMEFYDTVGVASATSDAKLFKLLNNRGTTMVLRSDMTAPIARVVSSLLKDQAMPLRLSYHANVFRSIEEEAGREAEFYQTGVELVGDGSAEADAEVIALAIASLKAAGIERFKIAIGHVGFLNGLLEDALQGRPEDQAALKEMLLSRNYVGYKDLLNNLNLSSEISKELADLLRLRGGEETCERALRVSSNETARAAIEHLCQVWAVLKAYDVTEHVLIDLTMIGDFSYYTGLTFEGYAADLGFPVVSGGRYDTLLDGFGHPAPATGFAIKTTRILELLDLEQTEEVLPTIIVYDEYSRSEALQRAQAMRQAGQAVITSKLSGAQELSSIVKDGRTTSYEGRLYADVIAFTEKGAGAK